MEQEYPKAITAVKARINPTIRTFDFLIPIIKKQNRLFLLRSPPSTFRIRFLIIKSITPRLMNTTWVLLDLREFRRWHSLILFF